MSDSVNPGPPRPLGPRRRRALETRSRMIRAAHELFCERGYGGTRIADVAELAGVAVQTVYFTFHTKPELLRACYEQAVLGEEDPTPPPEQPWYAALMAAGEAREAVGHFAAGNSAIAARVAVLDDVIRAAAHEPEAYAVRARSEQLRREGYGAMVSHLKARFGLRTGLTAETATDVLLVLGSGAMYRMLVVDFGWPYERFVAWLADIVGLSLLADWR